MEGRRYQKLLLTGCLILGTIGCSSRNANVTPVGPALPNTGVPMAAKPARSFWGGSSPAPTPVEVMTEAPHKGPIKPETHAILANVQLESAFDEKTMPESRESLLDSARAGYHRALKQDPKNKVALLGLAKYYARLGDREKAMQVYKQYFAEYPSDKDVAHEVAITHAQWKDWPGAVAWCEFALKIDPENLTIRKTLAFCLARAGKWDEAFSVMCQVMPEAQARYLMARVLEHQNQADACRMQLQLAIKADPDFAPARDFLAELDMSTRPDTQPNRGGDVRTVGNFEIGQ